jgi:hypothetical protein
MEKKFNYADFTQIGKKTLKEKKRIEEQTNSFVKSYDEKLRTDAALLEQKKLDESLSNARFSNSSVYAKNKQRVQAIKESISYADRASKAAMANYFSTIVESALLLDIEEYKKLNPGYKTLIKESVLSLLESNGISELVNDKRTLTIMEHIANSIPEVRTGVLLKEEEIIDIVKKSTPKELSSAIDSLIKNVRESVANIVVKEQDENKEIQKDVNDVMSTSEKAKDEKLEELGYSKEEIEASKQQAAMEPQGAAPGGMPPVGPDGQPMDPAAAGAQGGMPPIPPEIMAELEKQGITIDPQSGMPIGPDGQPVPPEILEQILGPMMGGPQSAAPGQEGAPQVGPDGQPMDPAAAGAQGGMPPIPPEIMAELEKQGITIDPQSGMPIGPDGQPVPPEVLEQILGPMMGGPQGAAPGGMPGQDPYADDEYLAYQQGQATPGFSAGAAPQASTIVPQTANKNTAVEVSPDGTVKVNIVRERFYREVPRQGILESLALNEANELLASGKKYDGDLALANALLHLTVLETFNVTGLIPLTDNDYRRMLNIPSKKKIVREELGSAAAEPVATTESKPKEHTPKIETKDVFTSEKHKQAEDVKGLVIESEELGSAAAEPVATSDSKPEEHTPEIENNDVFPAEEHKQAEEVKEVIVAESWKAKALKALKEKK